MFVNDRAEIGTSMCRPSIDLFGLWLNSREGSDSAMIVKPAHIRPRVSRIHEGVLSFSDTHYLCSARSTLC